MKLELNLIPKSSFYCNLRSEMGRQWDILSKRVREQHNYTCQICGVKPQTTRDVHLHELWSFNEETKIQKLIGFECICTTCHSVHHWGYSQIKNMDMNFLLIHACKVNKCSKNEFNEHIEESFRIWEKHSCIDWGIDTLLIKNIKEASHV
jgi:5-methylcytosine-specific restriction endonuclease McrA